MLMLLCHLHIQRANAKANGMRAVESHAHGERVDVLSVYYLRNPLIAHKQTCKAATNGGAAYPQLHIVNKSW